MNFDIDQYTDEAWELLKSIIEIPSVSGEESACSAFLFKKLYAYGLSSQVVGNNIYAFSPRYLSERQTILLSAHIDTIYPVATWHRNPYSAIEEGDRLYGLGSNDCGGGLVSLLQVFRILSTEEVGAQYNFVLLLSCEEECSGADGIERVLPFLPHVDVALVGEPTCMQPAIAEKGLMVLDLKSHGESSHAAHGRSEHNAIYEMMADVEWISHYRFTKSSPLLGDTLMQVTQISAGTQHNVVPDTCQAVVDVRTNEHYTNQEVFDIVASHCKSDVSARSFRLGSSRIDPHHPLIVRCQELGRTPFGSPTLSDQALMPFPSFKMGPGDSTRSHTADEYICKGEIREAIATYLKLFE